MATLQPGHSRRAAPSLADSDGSASIPARRRSIAYRKERALADREERLAGIRPTSGLLLTVVRELP